LGGESQVDFFLGNDDDGPKVIDVQDDANEFDGRVAEAAENKATVDNVGAYVKLIASQMETTAGEVKANAIQEWDNFWGSFKKWQSALGEKKAPASTKGKEPKRVADMTPEELVIHRIKKASKATIERVVINNLDAILASKEATELGMAKWGKFITKPWPGIKSEVIKDADTPPQPPNNAALDLLIVAREQSSEAAVDEAAKKLNVDVDNPTMSQAGEVYDLAAQIDEENKAASNSR